MYHWSVKKKEQEKIWYNKGVKTQYFEPGNFVLFKDSISYLGKLIEQWHSPFVIDSFGGDHNASYVLKTLDGDSVPNTYYDDHLYIFCPRERYLLPAKEEPLQVTRNLHFRKKKDWDIAGYLLQVVLPPGYYM